MSGHQQSNNVIMIGKMKDSTPTTPPSMPEIDLNALCQLKREVVMNLPTHCSYCHIEYPKQEEEEERRREGEKEEGEEGGRGGRGDNNGIKKGIIVELSDGKETIIAYCKPEYNGCGRSRVLFTTAGIELV